MKISIIIPYWNTRELTTNIINTLKQQIGLLPIEIILIDDASDGEIFIHDVNKYIRLNTNGGGCHARNIGVDVAEGEYITFIDSDDKILDGYIETLMRFTEEENDLSWISWDCPYGNAIVRDTKQINIAFWGCLFKRFIFDNLRFNEKLNVNEEPQFWDEVYKRYTNLKIGFSERMIYYYNIREESVTRRYQRGEIPAERE